MPEPRDFTLVRHGQTDYNASHTLNGDPAVPVSLDETGRESATHGSVFVGPVH